jgi:hypothetical protein
MEEGDKKEKKILNALPYSAFSAHSAVNKA